MILPTTYVSALLLVIVSFLCLGSWVNTFKLTGTRWRFELFYFDFAVGAILLSVLAAFTLGTMGSDLSFTDRMLVAGRTSQALAVAAGFIFNLGNMLLLAAVSLLGVAGTFPLSAGLAIIIASAFHFQPGNIFFLATGIVLMIVAVVLDTSACRIRERAARKAAAAKSAASATAQSSPKSVVRRGQRSRKMRRTSKGLLVAVLAGIALGLFYPVAHKGFAGDLGLGPYAGTLMFSLGVLVSTVILNFYFLNIAIEGGPLTFGAYFRGNARQHFLGFGGGALWAGGALAACLAGSTPPQTGLPSALMLTLPVASVLLVMFWGIAAWKEFAAAPKHAKLSAGLTAIFFSLGLILIGVALSR